MSTETPGPRRVRASDAEREQLAQIIRSAMGEGRLSLEEGEERLAKAYAAVYRDELAPLTADLPGGGWNLLEATPEALAAAKQHVRRHFGFTGLVAAGLIGLFTLTWLASGAVHIGPLILLGFVLLIALKRHRYRHWRGCHGSREGSEQQGEAPPWARGSAPPWARGWSGPGSSRWGERY